MFHRQMLCITVPCPDPDGIAQMLAAKTAGHLEPAGPSEPARTSRDALSELLIRTGFVHFATIALLPPGPRDDPQASTVQIVLELAIDAWLAPHDALRMLVAADEADHVLSRLLMNTEAHPDEFENFLINNSQGATGGFVGNRDRSVSQIRREATLFDRVRSRFRKQRQDTGNSTPADSASLINELSAWLATQPEKGWLQERIPRSFWRSERLGSVMRYTLASIASVLPAIVALVGIAGMLALAGVIGIAAVWLIAGPSAVGPALFGSSAHGALPAVLMTVVIALMFAFVTAIWISAVLNTSGFFVALVILAGFFCVSPWVLGFDAAIGAVIGWGAIIIVGVGAMAAATVVAALIALAITPRHLGALPVLGAFVVLSATAGYLLLQMVDWLARLAKSSYVTTTQLLETVQLPLGLPAMAVAWLIILGVFVLIALLVQPAARLVANGSRGLIERDRPRVINTLRAMQTHAAVERCEASLIDRQNHMLSVTEIRQPLWLMRPVLTATLAMIGLLGHMLYINGRLGQASGIHFGHWHVIDRGRRLLFMSNYDGTFGGYLDEFILGASPGINLIWRCTELRLRDAARAGDPAVRLARQFPPTRVGLFGGCRHEQAFKTYARASMLPHLFRFEAYPFACRDIARATQLREALAGPPSMANNDTILRALES